MQNAIPLTASNLLAPKPVFIHAGGNGALHNFGNGFSVLNLGAVPQGAIGQSAVLEIGNMSYIGQGDFTLSPGSAFYLRGPSSVTAHGPGGHDSIVLTAQTNTPGFHAAMLTFHQTQPGSADVTCKILVTDYVTPFHHAGL